MFLLQVASLRAANAALFRALAAKSGLGVGSGLPPLMPLTSPSPDTVLDPSSPFRDSPGSVSPSDAFLNPFLTGDSGGFPLDDTHDAHDACNNKTELRELHENFAQRHPRPRTCAQPTPPRLRGCGCSCWSYVHNPRPFIPVPLAACGKAHLECRLTGNAK